MKKAEEIGRAAVLGAGTMGHGIAQVLALAGVETRLYDVLPGGLEKAIAAVRTNLQKGVDKGKIEPAARDRALAGLRTTGERDETLDGVEVVVEAVPERLDLKRDLFGRLGELDAGVLLATNTSSLPVTDIASAAAHPERVLGMHFFNPVHIMKLVEVVCWEGTSQGAASCAMELSRRLGKEPIRVQDAPGFASSRLGIAIGLEAMRMVEAGVASAEDIDKAMTLGYGFPMGPLRLTDLVGLDVRLAIAEYLESTLGDRFTPPAILREKVEQGELGKKSGRGFYDWNDGGR